MSFAAIILSSVRLCSQLLSDELSYVLHCLAFRAVLAVPAVPIEKHEMHHALFVRPLLDAENTGDSRPLSAHEMRIFFADLHVPGNRRSGALSRPLGPP